MKQNLSLQELALVMKAGEQIDINSLAPRTPPPSVQSFDQWLSQNPVQANIGQSIEGGKIVASIAAEMVLRAHWREDGWKFMADSYAQSYRAMGSLAWRLISAIGDPQRQKIAREEYKRAVLTVEDKLKGTAATKRRPVVWKDELFIFITDVLRSHPNLARKNDACRLIADKVRSSTASKSSVENKHWNRRANRSSAPFYSLRKVREDVKAMLPDAIKAAGLSAA